MAIFPFPDDTRASLEIHDVTVLGQTFFVVTVREWGPDGAKAEGPVTEQVGIPNALAPQIAAALDPERAAREAALLALGEAAHPIVIAAITGLSEADPAVAQARQWIEQAKPLLYPTVRAALAPRVAVALWPKGVETHRAALALIRRRLLNAEGQGTPEVIEVVDMLEQAIAAIAPGEG